MMDAFDTLAFQGGGRWSYILVLSSGFFRLGVCVYWELITACTESHTSRSKPIQSFVSSFFNNVALFIMRIIAPKISPALTMAARDLTGLSGPMMNPGGASVSMNKAQHPPKKGPKSMNKKPPGAPKRFKRYDNQNANESLLLRTSWCSFDVLAFVARAANEFEY